MVNSRTLNGLFKPYGVNKKHFNLLDVIGISERKFWKIQFEQECSKATDESCINTECRYNYLDKHDDELYVDLIQEIQAERLEVEKRNEKYIKRNIGGV